MGELALPSAVTSPGESPAAVVRAALDRACAAPRLVLLLDYDGTLVPLAPTPEQAIPDQRLFELLAHLAARPRTAVHLVSGRRHETLERWFGHLPVGLHAEHGFWSRQPGAPWTAAPLEAGPWREASLTVLRRASERTPGTFVEEKSPGLAWHYRTADPELGTRRVRELALELSSVLSGSPAELLPGDTVLEIRPRGVNKGRAVALVSLAAEPGTLFLAMGDDRTDEDLFAALPEGSLAVHVGASPSRAPIRIADVAAARAMLEAVAASP